MAIRRSRSLEALPGASLCAAFFASMALATLAGCAMGRNARALADSHAKDMRIFGQYVLVTGSRTRHRVDAFGDAITANPVQTITARELDAMPGLSLGEKLSGPAGF